jgi:hypothetical protein
MQGNKLNNYPSEKKAAGWLSFLNLFCRGYVFIKPSSGSTDQLVIHCSPSINTLPDDFFSMMPYSLVNFCQPKIRTIDEWLQFSGICHCHCVAKYFAMMGFSLPG